MTVRRRAIARLVEAILATIILTSSLGISYFYLVPANPIIIRGSDDLAKLGYDMLNTLARQGGFEHTIINQTGGVVLGWEQPLTVALGVLLPPGILFNLTVYQMVNVTGIGSPSNLVDLKALNSANVTNAQSDSFLNAGSTAEVTFMFTTNSFYIFVMDLQLARSTKI